MNAVSIKVESVASILIVKAIEPCLPFWERIGAVAVAQVPHGDRLGFVMFALGNATVMLQSEESADSDVKIAPRAFGGALYVSVADLSAVEALIEPAMIVLPKRVTNYGATEIWVREPGGNLVGFAQHE